MAPTVKLAVAVAAFACLASLFVPPLNYSLPLHFSNPLSSSSRQHIGSNNPRHAIENITNTLGPFLSPTAQIHLPGSAGFNTSTDRWQDFAPPSFAVVVQVASEEDVRETVRWANGAGLPFLAISGGHGVVTSLGRFKGGVGIWMRELRGVRVLGDGGRARIGGGALSGEVVHGLWEEGKMTVTGACECTGMVAPMLGGGHGWLQGRQGLLADNLVSARLVLANGSAMTVSETEHPDLMWALKGAGHNFGIVTSFEYTVEDRTPETEMWSWELFIFRHDQLRDVYSLANGMLGGSMGEQPVELVHWSYFLRMPDVDPMNPVILFFLMYQSPLGVPAKYSAPLTALNPPSHTIGISNLRDFAAVGMLDMNGPFCQHGTTSVRFPVSTANYSLSALESAMATLASIEEPELRNNSAMIFEAYSLHAVQRIPPPSTAFPDRENGVLMAAIMMWDSAGLNATREKEIEGRAVGYAKAMRDVVVRASGGKLHAYLNYAHGDEGLEAMYGHESWRVERLRALKGEWDPENRFGWYAPIVG